MIIFRYLGILLLISSALICMENPNVKNILFQSKNISDEQIPNLKLTKVMIEIIKCKNLCLESLQPTSSGGEYELRHKHNILSRVEKEKPVLRQKKLLIQFDKLANQVDEELFLRCSNFAMKFYKF